MSIKETQKFNILLTGTRAPAALELSRIFWRAGCTVITAESIPHPLCRYSRSVTKQYLVSKPRQQTDQYLQELAAIIKKHNIDIVIPACEEVFYISKGKTFLESSHPVLIWVDHITKLEKLHNKYTFIQWAEELGFSVPVTFCVHSKEQIFTRIQESKSKKWVLKPVFSRFSSKVYFVDSSNIQMDAEEMNEQKPWVLQQFIEGKSLCTYGVAKDGKLLAHSAYTSYFRAGKGAGIHFHLECDPAIHSWVQSFVKKIHFTGQIAFDFIQSPDGVLYPIECNPRTTSGIHFFSSHPRISSIFLHPTIDPIVPMDPKDHMLSTAMLFYGLGSIRSFSQMKQWLHTFMTAKDVLFCKRDLLPAFYQWMTFIHFIKIAAKNKLSPIEASTWDIEWNGEKS